MFAGLVTHQWGLLRLSWLMGEARAIDVAEAWTAADHDAVLASLFEEHSGPLVRMARLFVDDLNAAEDLVQEAFLPSWRVATSDS